MILRMRCVNLNFQSTNIIFYLTFFLFRVILHVHCMYYTSALRNTWTRYGDENIYVVLFQTALPNGRKPFWILHLYDPRPQEYTTSSFHILMLHTSFIISIVIIMIINIMIIFVVCVVVRRRRHHIQLQWYKLLLFSRIVGFV